MLAERVAGRYRLESLLGRGAMAEVWQAHDRVLERPVAVKLLHAGADSAAEARFAREAHVAATLTHPNIVQVYDVGESEGRPFIVQECLPGGSLEDRLSPGARMDEQHALALARGLASGLAHAHARGLVHRDLKPGNLLFDEEGRTKIADFGVASLAGADTLTEAGTIVGTAAYLSPEQARGEPAVPASDVYAVGVLLYRVLSGRLPFEAKQPLEIARMHVEDVPAALRQRTPLAAIAMAALEKDWRDRPPGGASLLAALRHPASTAMATHATRVLEGRAEPDSRPSRGGVLTAGLGALAAVAAIGGALTLASFQHSPPHVQTPAQTPQREAPAATDPGNQQPRDSSPARAEPQPPPADSTVPPPPDEPVPTPPTEPTPPPVEPPPPTPPPVQPPPPPVEPPPPPTEPTPPPPPVEPLPPPPPPPTGP